MKPIARVARGFAANDGRRAAAFLLLVLLQACAPLPRLPPVPEAETERAVVPGIPESRMWIDRSLSEWIPVVLRDLARERDALLRDGQPIDPMPPINFLSISGGGDNGAFAAGLLSGWTASGTRPKFRVVTGISAGALIAPFAFLGPEYDDVVRTVATTLRPGDVFRERNRVAGLLSDGMASSEPLRRIVKRYVTAEVLAAVAREFQKGRALEIATTDLDAGRQVTWNMGEIAASGAPGALELFQNIMIASTSIPGAVSPVMIDVDVGNHHYQEMHVDGGVITQVFAYPTHALAELEKATGAPVNRPIHLFIVRNGRLDPEWSATPRRTLSVGGRAIGALIQAEGVDDVHRIYRTARQDHVDFKLAYIGPDFPSTPHETFDTTYMRALFDYGYRLAFDGEVWRSVPPGEE
jgi:predicted acylesterase/phospholipase RssA